MAQSAEAPAHRCLMKDETYESFVLWRQSLLHFLQTYSEFTPFLVRDCSWHRKSKLKPFRGFHDDSVDLPNRKSAAQKAILLECMLGQISIYCPVISRGQIINSSTSLAQIWSMICIHFGFSDDCNVSDDGIDNDCEYETDADMSVNKENECDPDVCELGTGESENEFIMYNENVQYDYETGVCERRVSQLAEESCAGLCDFLIESDQVDEDLLGNCNVTFVSVSSNGIAHIPGIDVVGCSSKSDEIFDIPDYLHGCGFPAGPMSVTHSEPRLTSADSSANDIVNRVDLLTNPGCGSSEIDEDENDCNDELHSESCSKDDLQSHRACRVGIECAHVSTDVSLTSSIDGRLDVHAVIATVHRPICSHQDGSVPQSHPLQDVVPDSIVPGFHPIPSDELLVPVTSSVGPPRTLDSVHTVKTLRLLPTDEMKHPADDMPLDMASSPSPVTLIHVPREGALAPPSRPPDGRATPTSADLSYALCDDGIDHSRLQLSRTHPVSRSCEASVLAPVRDFQSTLDDTPVSCSDVHAPHGRPPDECYSGLEIAVISCITLTTRNCFLSRLLDDVSLLHPDASMDSYSHRVLAPTLTFWAPHVMPSNQMVPPVHSNVHGPELVPFQQQTVCLPIPPPAPPFPHSPSLCPILAV
ncbi:uncharacterized protein LOC121421741 [Lytechinus variegatus]|uniref:uncharacterized protein LOC121421741 n=1 Tax=Lytechinus variegatus TaxID=7654 RepID=UPI001BB19C7C|nr:uncharacterized protein LOC121421741 [Lytechinus variegatus]